MNDLEKAIEKARLQRLAQSNTDNNSRDLKSHSIEKQKIRKVDKKSHATNATKIGTRDKRSRSKNVPETRAVEVQPKDVNQNSAHTHENHPRNSVEFKRAKSLGSNSNYETINGDSYSNYDAINGDNHIKFDAINGDNYFEYDAMDGDSFSKYDAIDSDSFSKYDAINGDSNSKYDAVNGDSNSNHDAVNGDCNTNHDAVNAYRKTNHDDVNGDNNSNHDAVNGDNNSNHDAVNSYSNSKYNAKKISPDSDSENSLECVLPLERMQSAGFITPTLEKGKLTEEFRRIKRPLLKNLSNDVITNGLKNVIAVTSSVSGEGKTYSAVNLAMSMALERDRSVLLLDADVVKGAAGKLFSISQDQPGLTNVLSDDSIDAADVIMKTNVRKLRFMPSGFIKPNTNELLSSDTMTDLMVELARQYDDRIIILDCPPILQTNEASILVDHAGQVVFVVAEEETRQKLVLSAIEQIDKEKYVGVLMNKSNSRVGNYDYYRPNTSKW